MSEQMIGFGFALLAMLAWGVGNGVVRTPAKRMGVLNALLYRNLFTAMATVVIAAFVVRRVEWDWGQALLAVALSGIGYLSLLAMFRAKQTGKVGVISPVANSSVLLTVLIAVVGFGERLALAQWAAIAAILTGIVVATVNFRQWRDSDLLSPSSGVPFALITALCWGVMFAFLKFPSALLGAVVTALVLNISNFAMSVVHLGLAREAVQRPDRCSLAVLVLIGICGASAIVSYNYALNRLDVAIATVVAFSNPMVTILTGMLVYGERHGRQAVLGMALMVGGIIATYYFK